MDAGHIEQCFNFAQTLKNQVADGAFKFRLGDSETEVFLRPRDSEQVAYIEGAGRPRREGDSGIFARLDEPRLSARLHPCPVDLGMLGLVALAHELPETLIEFISPNAGITRIEHLG